LVAATVSDGPGMVWKAGAFQANGARSEKALDTERIDPPIDDRCAICGRTDDLKDIATAMAGRSSATDALGISQRRASSAI